LKHIINQCSIEIRAIKKELFKKLKLRGSNRSLTAKYRYKLKVDKNKEKIKKRSRIKRDEEEINKNILKIDKIEITEKYWIFIEIIIRDYEPFIYNKPLVIN